MDLCKKSVKKYSLLYPVIIMLLNDKLIHWVCCDMKIPPREYNRDIIDSYPCASVRLTNTAWYLHVRPDITQPIKRQRHLPLLKPLLWHHFDGQVQGCNNSSVLAMKLLQSCTKPLIWYDDFFLFSAHWCRWCEYIIANERRRCICNVFSNWLKPLFRDLRPESPDLFSPPLQHPSPCFKSRDIFLHKCHACHELSKLKPYGLVMTYANIDLSQHCLIQRLDA